MEPKITNLKQLFIKNASNYLLTNDKDIDENDFIDKIAKYLNSGVKIIEYIPSKSDRYSLKIAKKLRQLTSMFGALLLIKGRCDILKIAKADGIAFDEADFDIDDILKIVDNDCYFSLNHNKLE